MNAFTSQVKQNAYDAWKEQAGPLPAFIAAQTNHDADMRVNGYWNNKGQCECHKPNTLPPLVVKTFMILSAIWEIDTQIWWALPMTIFIWTIDLADFAIDQVLWYSLALFRPVAFIAIWVLNFVQLPLNFIGMYRRLMAITMTIPIQAPLWLFGDGCFIRWGPNCFNPGPSKYRNDPRQRFKVPIFAADLENLPPAPESPPQPSFHDNFALNQNFA